jgi:hypothetical protein
VTPALDSVFMMMASGFCALLWLLPSAWKAARIFAIKLSLVELVLLEPVVLEPVVLELPLLELLLEPESEPLPEGGGGGGPFVPPRDCARS